MFKHLRQASYITTYISMILPRYNRSLWSQIRSGTLPIRIESGRFRNEPLADILCILCETNDVEDEIHFISFCSKYTGWRQTLFFQYTGGLLSYSQLFRKTKMCM